MKIALAQTHAVKGDIPANIENHLEMIRESLMEDVDAVFFPELSLTGYEPELADALASTPDDGRLAVFQQMSNVYGLTIGVGMPVRTDMGVTISMLVYQPHAPWQVYAKQQLHADEQPYFVEGEQQLIFRLGSVPVTPAICYESLQTNHAEKARQLGAKVYLASVAKSKQGIDKAKMHYPAVARQYGMPVLMVNCVGFCDNFESVGRSGYWNANGELVAQLGDEEGILVVEVEDILWNLVES